MGLETRRRKTLDYTTDLKIDEIKYKEPNASTNPSEQHPLSKEELLKKFGLFTEQDAGKATIHTSLENKESAEDYELAIKEAIRKIQEMRDQFAHL